VTGKTLLNAMLAATLVFLVSVSGTLAYWTGYDTSVNIIKTASVFGEIVENCDPASARGVYPGDTVTKIVNVQNTGTVDELVRVKIEKVWRYADSASAADPSHAPGFSSTAALPTDNIVLNLGRDGLWTDGGDGYYYYKGVLPPGRLTDGPVLESFTIDPDTGNEYAGLTGDIIVTMECVQYANGGPGLWGKTYADIGVPPAPAPSASPDAFGLTITAPDAYKSIPSDNYNQDIGPLFDFENLLPGDVRVSPELSVTNAFGGTAHLYLRAEPAAQSGGLTASQLLALNGLLTEFITVTVTDAASGALIYRGPACGNYGEEPSAASGNDSMKYDIDLGQVDAGGSVNLRVALSFANVDNGPQAGSTDYENLPGYIKWVISAEGESPVSMGDLGASQTPEPSESPAPTVKSSESPVPSEEPTESPAPTEKATASPGPAAHAPVGPTYTPAYPQNTPLPEPKPASATPEPAAFRPARTPEREYAEATPENMTSAVIPMATPNRLAVTGRHIPKTGDPVMMPLMAAVAGLSFLSIVVLAIAYARRRKREAGEKAGISANVFRRG